MPTSLFGENPPADSIDRLWRNFLRGIVKSPPVVGAFLEQLIFGTLDENERADEREELRRAFANLQGSPAVPSVSVEKLVLLAKDESIVSQRIEQKLDRLLSVLHERDIDALPGDVKRSFEEFVAKHSHAVEFYSCFISYSNDDHKFAERLYSDLQNNGVRCWFAPHDIQSGKKIHEQIDGAIRNYDRLLLVLSEHSMASEWVKTEIANARRKEVDQDRQVLFPVRLVDFDAIKRWTCFDADTGKDSAREIREYHLPDFSNWQDDDSYQKALKRLVRDLKA